MAKKPRDRREARRPSATQQQSSGTEVSDTELRTRLGKAVRLARLAHDLTQEQLGKRIGKSQNFIYTTELGKTDPGVIALLRISQVLNVSLDLFLAPIMPANKTRSDQEQEVMGKAQHLLVSLLKSVQDTTRESGPGSKD